MRKNYIILFLLLYIVLNNLNSQENNHLNGIWLVPGTSESDHYIEFIGNSVFLKSEGIKYAGLYGIIGNKLIMILDIEGVETIMPYDYIMEFNIIYSYIYQTVYLPKNGNNKISQISLQNEGYFWSDTEILNYLNKIIPKLTYEIKHYHQGSIYTLEFFDNFCYLHVTNNENDIEFAKKSAQDHVSKFNWGKFYFYGRSSPINFLKLLFP